MNTLLKILLIISLLIFQFNGMSGQKSDSLALPTIFDFLGGEEVVDMELNADISWLILNKNTDDYIKGSIEVKRPDKSRDELEMKIKPRGKFRRMICAFPPLKLKFKKKTLRSMGLDTFNNLKLVTHCMEDRIHGNENVLKEYLAYQLFGILSEEALRVQLVKVKYKDENGGFPSTRRYGFLIEDDEELAFRHGGLLCDCYNEPNEGFDPYQREVVAIFQYMIGNTDWDVTMNRNLEIIDRGQEKKKLIVPYDFDFSGMVQSGYAIPTPGLGLSSVRERYYLGKAESQVAREVRDHFLSKKPELLEYVKNFRLLSSTGRSEVLDYLESFFNEIEAEKQLDQSSQ